MAKLGDAVCITPILRAIRVHQPDTKIFVLGDAVNKEVLNNNPDVDEYIVFDGRRVFQAVYRLRKERIEAAIIRGTNYRGLIAVILAGVPFIIATRIDDARALATRTYRKLLPFVCTVEIKFGEYMPRQLLRLLEPLGIYSKDTTKHLAYSSQADQSINNLFSAEGIRKEDLLVGISPAAGNRIKQWPPDRFSEVADYLIERYGARIIVIGGPTDASEVEMMMRTIKMPESVVNTAGTLTIDELKALIARLDMFISVDTGPIYIAEAFNVPTVDITGPIDEREQPPIGPYNKVVHISDRHGPELFVMSARAYNAQEARRQTDGVTVAMVTDAINEIFDRLNAHA